MRNEKTIVIQEPDAKTFVTYHEISVMFGMNIQNVRAQMRRHNVPGVRWGKTVYLNRALALSALGRANSTYEVLGY